VTHIFLSSYIHARSFFAVNYPAKTGILVSGAGKTFHFLAKNLFLRTMNSVETHITGTQLSLTVLVNRLDANTARDFKKEIEAAWQPEISTVTADLSKVEFIDSSGVGALLGIYKRLPAGNPGIRLRGVCPGVHAVIELLRLHRIFDIEA